MSSNWKVISYRYMQSCMLGGNFAYRSLSRGGGGGLGVEIKRSAIGVLASDIEASCESVAK